MFDGSKSVHQLDGTSGTLLTRAGILQIGTWFYGFRGKEGR